MNLLIRQIWALTRKNWLLICVRRPFSTVFRALVLPLVIILILAYSKNFFASSQHWGLSSPNELRTLEASLAASHGHDIVGFVDNGLKGGDIASVIDALSQRIQAAGKIARVYNDSGGLALECRTDDRGSTPCYGAVVFLSSPTEGTNISSPGVWNYTMRGTGGGFVDVRTTENFAERDLLPFQRALDMEIIAQSQLANKTQLPSDIQVIAFTNQDQDALSDSRTDNYLALAIYVFGPLFAFTLVEIVYHMTSFVSRERELGMSGLIDTMIPGGSNIRGRLVRQTATYLSFAAVYLPSWLAVGIVLSVIVFPNFSESMPLGFTLLSGFALCGFALFGASFFKKAQLSGSIMIVITIVFAILPVVIIEQTSIICGILSVLCPSSNFTYFITGIATFEAAARPVSMVGSAYDGHLMIDSWRLPLYVHWILLIVHIIVFPVLAFWVEHVFFSTASQHRQFTSTVEPGAPTVILTRFGKTYQTGIFARIFKRRKDVQAVTSLDFKAYPGQILCLLGPNGSGKSTTLNCIAGFQKVSDGNITIDSTGGLGYAPQHNVIWPELTVQEHVRIFSDLKCLAAANNEVVNELVGGVDLTGKLFAKAKTLSGGQKRKLQLAMMFAGGSSVCCVDEVSTGLDPISRRRIWEILLAERSRRSIIMTTHFLDEADYLADHIAIMYKGALRASGTSASLKHAYGNGYTVKLPCHQDIDLHISEPVEKELSRLQTIYRVSTGAAAVELVDKMEQLGLREYQISGPTMEELFMKVTGDSILSTDDTSEERSGDDNTAELKAQPIKVIGSDVDYELTEGRPISAFQQWRFLLCKRFYIFKRRWVPYFVAVAFALVGAGVAPLLIKSYNMPMACPTPADLVNDYNYRNDFGTRYYASSYSYTYNDDDNYRYKYVYGPASSLNESRLSLMANVYSVNHTLSYSDTNRYGYSNSTQILDQLILVETYDDFSNAVRENWKNQSARYNVGIADYSPWTTLTGGFWMGNATSKPTVMVNIRQPDAVNQIMNFYMVMASGIGISSSYYGFATTKIPDLINFKALIFIVYFGLIMACYPVFFILYPTNERISNVRSMQYSNGIRPLPLWLSHLSFDGMFIIVISAVATGLITLSTPVWHGMGFVFVIFMLYGVVCALVAYNISMFAKNAITAWFMMALGQVILYFAYFGGIIGIQSGTAYEDLDYSLNALYFGLSIISPVVSLERTLFIGLQQLGIMCNGQANDSIYMYGGPILYLIIQAVLLFALLLWWDSGFKLPSFRARMPVRDTEATGLFNADLTSERKRLESPSTDLRVERVSRAFGKNLAVDDVTFGVQTSEIFALLGPNGAGKSTIISMIRGDIKPSTTGSTIDVAGHSVLTSAVAARASLGVCPQFDSADALTIRETLRFFAKIRGVKDIEHNVSTVINVCGIEQWADQLAQKLSGGTKRKLSLAVALVGNPQVLILDEPSSALDANAKRILWRCLQIIAKRRAVLLTTHSMEEADALADRIGIVSSRMLALGGREELKKRAGDAYHVHVVSQSAPRTTPAELNMMREWVLDAYPDAVISRETQGGQVRFEVPVEKNDIAGLIRKLEGSKDRLRVEYYSVGKATLDEVFEKIVGRHSDTGV